MSSNLDLFLSDAQIDFLNSPPSKLLFCGGVGSGKTFSGALWAIKMITEYPEAKGLITANSYKQLRDATLAELFKLLDMFGIKYTFKINSAKLYVGDTEVLCMSTEDPDSLVGFEVGWAWSDECAFYKELSFNKLSARIRDTRGPCLWRGTTTPNGFNWLYEYFVEKNTDYKKVVYSKTTDNSDNLPVEYINELKDQYDNKLALQELDGAFVNLSSGKVYYSFDRRKHLADLEYNKESNVTYIGLDFNVHPLCGVVVVQKGNTIYVVDEIYLEDSNTFKAAKHMRKMVNMPNTLMVCDETGNRRKSSSNKTDHQILREAGFELMPFKNPSVKDRYNNINKLIDKGRLKISPNCKYLIKDLEQLVYDNKDDMLSHISDALGYICWKLDPLVKPKRRARIINP